MAADPRIVGLQALANLERARALRTEKAQERLADLVDRLMRLKHQGCPRHRLVARIGLELELEGRPLSGGHLRKIIARILSVGAHPN